MRLFTSMSWRGATPYFSRTASGVMGVVTPRTAVVLLSVTVGGGIFGIVGAFLAVPAAAMITEVVRYLGDMGDLATGEKQVEDIEFATIMTRKKQERIEAEKAKKGNLASRIFRRKKKDTAKDSVSG